MVLNRKLDSEPNINQKLLKAELVETIYDYLRSPIFMKTPGGDLTVLLEEGETIQGARNDSWFYGVSKRKRECPWQRKAFGSGIRVAFERKAESTSVCQEAGKVV